MAWHAYRKREGVVTVYESLSRTAYKQRHGNVSLRTFRCLFPLCPCSTVSFHPAVPFSAIQASGTDRKSPVNSSACQTIGDFTIAEEPSNDRKTIRNLIGPDRP